MSDTLTVMTEEQKKPKPRGRPRKRRWPEPIPDDPENIMRIVMRTPREVLDVNTAVPEPGDEDRRPGGGQD